jgi:peroxisomal membrane protein 4
LIASLYVTNNKLNMNGNSNNNSASPDGGCGGLLLPITEQSTSSTTTTTSSSSSSSSLLLWDEVAAILSGLIGGGKYGLKIRIPHAVVMTFLFGNNLSFRNKLKVIAKLAAEHSINLASFACLYKFLLASLKTLSRLLIVEDHQVHSGVIRRFIKYCISMVINGPPLFPSSSKPTKNNNISNNNTLPGLPEHPYHAFLAGTIGGYCIWGKYSSVNYQLVLYLTSRIIVGCIKLAREKGYPPFSWKRLTFNKLYPYGAALIWGTVMMLFEEYPNVLHPSLRRSMDEIYRFGSFGTSSSSSSP